MSTLSKIFRATLSALNIRKSDRHYRWYYYHHI
ncbi:hypothetical protein SAMN05421504_108297 [Amycolatopsis xylanica]|uniref:Uncharacterized protein n=1 Tax=Amycolatopsis xylanica TaxID=589385 RepID=A0A1H3PME0_9PSEU|nr:hypothetical protein SAMN05421504_108297 [Amycolatopsis xylanica]